MVSIEEADRFEQALKAGYEALNSVQLHVSTAAGAMKAIQESGATSHRAGEWCHEARWLYGLLNDRVIGIMTAPMGS